MSNKKTILFIMHMPPPVHGASMMGQFVHDSELVNESFKCHYVNLTVASRLEDVGRGGWHKMKGIFKKMVEIWRSVKRLKPDLVYITSNSAGAPFYKDFFTIMMLKMMNKKIVMHFHNKGVATRQSRWLDNWMYCHYFENSKLILLSDSLYDDVKKYIDKENVYVCPNAIPKIPLANDTFVLHEKSNHYMPHILWLTNIMRTKGVLEYLSALKLLKERHVAFQADFVGGLTKDMTAEEFCAALASFGLNDCCAYHGPKYGNDKYEFFRNADIFVLPSYTEAFPVTILEAMHFGIPVVASNVGGVSAEVEDGVTGFLLGGHKPIMLNTFRPDVYEIADKLEKLLKDGSLRQYMGLAGREKFEREFTLDVFERRFVNILSQCVE